MITLNRPDRLNAFNEAMHQALRAAIDEAEADNACRALLITGAGRGFCAGQDLNDRLAKPGETTGARRHAGAALQSAGAQAARTALSRGRRGQRRRRRRRRNIALACDIVLAARSANFIQSFARIGLVPDSGGTWFLPRLVGEARARGLALLAEPLPAEKAESWGLIWKASMTQR